MAEDYLSEEVAFGSRFSMVSKPSLISRNAIDKGFS
jgi:hypothetical protein